MAVRPATLPVRQTASRRGRDTAIAPDGSGGFYAAIPTPDGVVLVGIDRRGRVGAGWPLSIDHAQACAITADQTDASLRAICRDDVTTVVFAFDAAGRSLPGWPTPTSWTPYQFASPIVLGGNLYYVSDARLIRVGAKGDVETGTPIGIDPLPGASVSDGLMSLAPDGTAYIVVYTATTPYRPSESQARAYAFAMNGVIDGWPHASPGANVSSPGFGPDGRVYLSQSIDHQRSKLIILDAHGRTIAVTDVAGAATPDWRGAAAFDVPAAPVVSADGTAFVVSYDSDGNGDFTSIVRSFSPTGDALATWSAPGDLAWTGWCSGCETGCGTALVPPVARNGVVYVAQATGTDAAGGSISAIGRDGATLSGWPVQLRRPGAAFNALMIDRHGTLFALAVEPEPGPSPKCEPPPASATVLAVEPDGLVRYRVTLVEP